MLEVTAGMSSDLDGRSTRTVVAVAVAHLAHLWSVLALDGLTRTVFSSGRGEDIAFLAASLHIISPAGLFLSAPYAESLFALLTFLAYHLYVGARWSSKAYHEHHTHAYLVAAGLLFGLATAVRSNGLLNGAVLLDDLIVTLRDGSGPLLQARRLRRLTAIGASGALLALGALIPQILAYRVFCQTGHPSPSPSSPSMTPNTKTRPWCSNAVPSVYAWAQDHHWSVMTGPASAAHTHISRIADHRSQECGLPAILDVVKRTVVPHRQSDAGHDDHVIGLGLSCDRLGRSSRSDPSTHHDHGGWGQGRADTDATGLLRRHHDRGISSSSGPPSAAAGRSGADQLPCSDHQPHLLRLRGLVLVDRHGDGR